jgi:hypothetical protein
MQAVKLLHRQRPAFLLMQADLAEDVQVFHGAQKAQAPALEGTNVAQFCEYAHPGIRPSRGETALIQIKPCPRIGGEAARRVQGK